MKRRRRCRDLIAAFWYLRGGYQQGEARLSTEVCDRRTKKTEMPTLHKIKKIPHCDTSQALRVLRVLSCVISVLGGFV